MTPLTYSSPMLIPDGFPGQRLRVLPHPLQVRVSTEPVLSKILVTDIGYFPHAHDHGRERGNGVPQTIVILCVGGTGWVAVGDSDPELVSTGSAAVIPAGVTHRYWADAEDPWTIWWAHVTGHDVNELARAILNPARDHVFPVRDMFTAAALLEQALTTLERDETEASLLASSGAAWNLLAHLAADRKLGSPITADRIQIVQEHLRRHLDKQISVGQLAALAGLSGSHFSAMFKTATGMGVVEYQRRLRIARARELLLSTRLSIAEIAGAVGYTDQFYFSRQFRAVTGSSPSEFRAAKAKDSA